MKTGNFGGHLARRRRKFRGFWALKCLKTFKKRFQINSFRGFGTLNPQKFRLRRSINPLQIATINTKKPKIFSPAAGYQHHHRRRSFSICRFTGLISLTKWAPQGICLPLQRVLSICRATECVCVCVWIFHCKMSAAGDFFLISSYDLHCFTWESIINNHVLWCRKCI